MGKFSEMHIAMQDELFSIADRAENGEMNYLDALLEMREFKSDFEKSLEIIADFETGKIDEISREASKFPEGYKGFDVKIVNGRRTFDFKAIPEWSEIDAKRKEVEAKYKSIFDAMEKGSKFANVDDSGEELPLPEVKYSKSYLTIKKKR